MATPVLLAEVHRPSQERGRALLRRVRNARCDEQRGVAIVLSPGVAEYPLESLLSCNAHRVDDSVAVRVGQRDAGSRALDQRNDRERGQRRFVLLVRQRQGIQRISARRLEFRHEGVGDGPVRQQRSQQRE